MLSNHTTTTTTPSTFSRTFPPDDRMIQAIAVMGPSALRVFNALVYYCGMEYGYSIASNETLFARANIGSTEGKRWIAKFRRLGVVEDGVTPFGQPYRIVTAQRYWDKSVWPDTSRAYYNVQPPLDFRAAQPPSSDRPQTVPKPSPNRPHKSPDNGTLAPPNPNTKKQQHTHQPASNQTQGVDVVESKTTPSVEETSLQDAVPAVQEPTPIPTETSPPLVDDAPGAAAPISAWTGGEETPDEVQKALAHLDADPDEDDALAPAEPVQEVQDAVQQPQADKEARRAQIKAEAAESDLIEEIVAKGVSRKLAQDCVHEDAAAARDALAVLLDNIRAGTVKKSRSGLFCKVFTDRGYSETERREEEKRRACEVEKQKQKRLWQSMEAAQTKKVDPPPIRDPELAERMERMIALHCG